MSHLREIIRTGILMLLCVSMTAHGNSRLKGPGLLDLDGLSGTQKIEVVRTLKQEVAAIAADLESKNESIKDGKLYYNIGDIGSIITGWLGVMSLPFIRFRGSGTYGEKLRKNNFVQDGCTNKVAQLYVDTKTVKFRKKLEKRGNWLKFRKLEKNQIDESVVAYRDNIKNNMTYTTNEMSEKVAEFAKRKKIAWWTFAGSLTAFTGLKITEYTQADRLEISAEEKEELQERLERKERQLHNMEQTLLMFAD